MIKLYLDSGSDESDLDIASVEEYKPPPQPIDIILWDAIRSITPTYCIGNKTSEIGTAAFLQIKGIFTKPYVDVIKK